MHSIILDTDPGVDDAMALFLALRSPEINVLGLTTVFGNTNVEATTRNALRLLEVAGRSDIPVARGAAQPLVLPSGRMAEFVHGPDGMGGIGWDTAPAPVATAHGLTAAEFMVEMVSKNPGKVTLVAVGPLTNLALALQLEPRLATLVRQVVIMGGAILCPGNCSPIAEANIFNDPHAADEVFKADWEVTVVGLDVTLASTMDNSDFEFLRTSGDPLAEFVGKIVPFYQTFYASRDGNTTGAIPTHDPSAISYLIDPTLFESESHALRVATEGLALGAIIADRRGWFYNHRKSRCLLKVDASRLRRLFLDRLSSKRSLV